MFIAATLLTARRQLHSVGISYHRVSVCLSAVEEEDDCTGGLNFGRSEFGLASALARLLIVDSNGRLTDVVRERELAKTSCTSQCEKI